MAKHTPGPWQFLPHRASLVHSVVSQNSGIICEVYISEPDKIAADANANLIAAAPDLLEACQQLMEFWDNGTPVHPGAEIVDDVRRAIAKATGQR